MQADLVALKAEVLGYKGLTDDQVDELLLQEAQPVCDSRTQAAQQLLECAEVFLQRQAAEWHLAVQVLSSWFSSLVSLFESHKASTAAAEAGIKAAQRAAMQQFAADDAAREAALASAVQLLSQSSDEKELDARLEDALQALGAIQQGYRAHAASAIQTVRAYPARVKGQSDMYIKCLCGLMHVQPQQQLQHSSPSGEAQAAADAAPPTGSAQPASAATEQPGRNGSMEQSCVQEHIQLPTGGVYLHLHDLWAALQDATPKPWLEEFKQLQLQQDRSSSCAAEPQAAQVDTAAPPTAAAAAPKAAPTGKLTKQQLAEAAAAEEAARAAEAAAAAAEAATAALAAAAAPPPCPTGSSSFKLCLDLQVPHTSIKDGLGELQVRQHCHCCIAHIKLQLVTA